jgi:alpha-L-fucosidase
MRYVLTIVTFLLVTALGQPLRAQTPGVSVPAVAALAAGFKNPPPGYGPTVTWGWQGAVDSAVINRDLDELKALGFRMVTIEGGHMPEPYLSEGYFKLIRYAVQEAKKRGLRVWFIDEGKYPSGFAGGLFTSKRPGLRMQALLRQPGPAVAAGAELSGKAPAAAVGAVAVAADGDSSVPLAIRDGRLRWKAPAGQGDWRILYAVHAFRTSPTRSSNNPTGAKDQTNSLCDYLNPEATRQFLAFTHEQYKKYVGDEFGHTVVGFRSDEPAYSYTPWTPEMLREFKKRKGYDIAPYLASFFVRHPTQKERLARADYWEVFSELFRDHFFKVISEWCVKNHLEYEDHLDHDGPEDGKTMLELGSSEGDYFRDMRYLQVPGIDVIWHQLWPGEPNDFPKLASSAAHLFGRSQVFSESFAAFRPAPDIRQVSWILNEQLVRGVNLFEIMFYPTSTGRWRGPHGFMASDSFPAVMRATSRKAYVLANGRPAADIGVYFPTSALWLRDSLPNTATWRIARGLLEHQRDFDFVDYQSVASLMTLKKGKLVNASGQQYSLILVPPMRIISRKVLGRLHDFARQGGRVVFMGHAPEQVRGASFLDEKPMPPHPWAFTDTSGDISSIAGLLPPADVHFTTPCPAVKYTHRHLKDGELYFFFNESDRHQARTASLQGSGLVQVWNPRTGVIVPAGGCHIGKEEVTIPLDLAPHESRIVVIGPLPEKYLPAYYRTHVHPRFTDYLPNDTVNRLPPGPFQASWPSLTANYQVPAWFKDAKFGIFIHWGLYAIPAHHNEWYARHMYQTGPIADWHAARYGAQDSFGYKDFIPLFQAKKFDPQQWADLFREAGAKHVVPVAEHHDGFKMYASDLTVWDAADMGPHRDIVGELAKAVRRDGLIFGLSDHQIENWSFMYPGLKKPTDIFDAKNAGFYGPPQPPGSTETQAFLNQWLAIAEELVDKYHPRLFYFDNGVDSSRLDSMKQRFAAYYYNRANSWDKGPVICTKFYAYPDAAGVHEYEKQGRSPKTIQRNFWQTDDVISNFSWGYVSDMRYRSAGSILHELIDNVSKNGALLLNISPRGDGSIPEEQQRILRSIGGWLRTNGEAIYGSRPWTRFGEGPSADTTVNLGRYRYTGRDFRFTRKGDTLYAIAMAWPGKEARLTCLGRGAAAGRVTAVALLGSAVPVRFRQTADALVLQLPAEKPGDYAYVFRITGLKLNQDDQKNK